MGKKNSHLGRPKPLKALKKGELLEELRGRGLLGGAKSEKKIHLEN